MLVINSTRIKACFHFQIQMPLCFTFTFTFNPNPSSKLPYSPTLLQVQPVKNPNKTLIHSLIKIMSWTCSSCTFLNPPSQKSTCQICLTPSQSSSSSTHKWACKACTFLNSYNRSNCEICDTRASFSSLSTFDDLDPDDNSGGSSVGSVFFPLRRCNTGQTQDLNGFPDLGFEENVGNGDHFVGKGVDFGGSWISGSKMKRKFEDPVLESIDAICGFGANKKENAGAEKGSVLVEIPGNVDGTSRINNKRKMQDLGNFVGKAIESDGFRDAKYSKDLSLAENTNGISKFLAHKKVGNVAAATGSTSTEISQKDEDKKASGEVKILSYNVWFREDLEVHKRMQAIGDLIQKHSPDVICFQEVTPNIYSILSKSVWWKQYRCSVSYERAACEVYFCMQLAKLPVKSFSCKPFGYTAMGRELCIAEIETIGDKSLVIATSHLESPCPGPPTWDQMFSKERVNQANEAITFLQKYPNVIFCGDMNWDDKHDGQFPSVEGWFDAWEMLRPGEIGCTYDTKSNKMLTGNRTLQKRLDRFICHLTDFDVIRMDMIGTEAIPGLTYNKQKKMKNKIQELILPVLPSDHYGLLLTITSM